MHDVSPPSQHVRSMQGATAKVLGGRRLFSGLVLPQKHGSQNACQLPCICCSLQPELPAGPARRPPPLLVGISLVFTTITAHF